MIEHAFEIEDGVMPGAAVVAEPLARAGTDQAHTVRELQERIRGMQRTRLDTRALPTHPALVDLLPGGSLAAGQSYAVSSSPTLRPSTTLALALAQGPSAAGSWCALVGLPDLGVGAAARLGIDLERTVLVPHPGEQWLSVVSALVDVVSVLVVRAPARRGPTTTGPGSPQLSTARVGEAAASRLASRLRQREAVLVSVGDWPGSQARLRITESSWSGLGAGFGHLAGRMVTVASASASWSGRDRSRRLWLPGPDGRVAPVEAASVPLPSRDQRVRSPSAAR